MAAAGPLRRSRRAAPAALPANSGPAPAAGTRVTPPTADRPPVVKAGELEQTLLAAAWAGKVHTNPAELKVRKDGAGLSGEMVYTVFGRTVLKDNFSVKLEPDGTEPVHFLTVWKVGYRFQG